MERLRPAPYGQRPSASADASRRAERARMAALDPWERMILALELGRRTRVFFGSSAGKTESRRRGKE